MSAAIELRDVRKSFGNTEIIRGVDLAVEKLGPIGAEMKRLAADPGYVDAVLIDGADRARAIADTTMASVKDIVGFVRKK